MVRGYRLCEFVVMSLGIGSVCILLCRLGEVIIRFMILLMLWWLVNVNCECMNVSWCGGILFLFVMMF